MKRIFIIFAALTCVASAQTYRTVTADTNNVIRTNFLLHSNTIASILSNVVPFPSYTSNAAKVLAVRTNETGIEWVAVSNAVTDASLLTNFPSLLLRTNGSAEALTNFPSNLLRVDGDAFLLTNFPTLNQNTTGTAANVTGVVAIANGGTGASTLTNARIALLPSYTGNSNRVLVLNSNATDILWTNSTPVDLSAPIVTNTLPITKGGSGATNVTNALINFGVIASTNSSVKLPSGNTATGNAAVAIGYLGIANQSGAIVVGYDGDSTAVDAIAIGWQAAGASTRSIAVGRNATAGGTGTNNVQIGTGTNNTSDTIQYLSAGSVDTNEWSALATLSTQGRYAMTNTAGISGSKTFVAYDGTNYTTNTVTFSNGIITGWTP